MNGRYLSTEKLCLILAVIAAHNLPALADAPERITERLLPPENPVGQADLPKIMAHRGTVTYSFNPHQHSSIQSECALQISAVERTGALFTAYLGSQIGDFNPVFSSGLRFSVYRSDDPTKPVDIAELSIDATFSPLPIRFSTREVNVGSHGYWTNKMDLPQLAALMVDMATGNWQYTYRTKEMIEQKHIWVVPGLSDADREKLVKCVTE